jgi:phosphomannomutase
MPFIDYSRAEEAGLICPGFICLQVDGILQYLARCGKSEVVTITKHRSKGKEKMISSATACFKAYDIRGRVPDELNADIAVKIGRSFAAVYGLKKVVVGRDIRLSSEELVSALTEGLRYAGVDVIDIGLCGTEEIYHAAFSMEGKGVDGGVVVTASHNPADYNGMKCVVRGARPVTGETGLVKMAELINLDKLPGAAPSRGSYRQLDNKSVYRDHLLGYLDIDTLRPLKIVANSGNGCAGAVIDSLEKFLPFYFYQAASPARRQLSQWGTKPAFTGKQGGDSPLGN